jgi:hypothetical protein
VTYPSNGRWASGKTWIIKHDESRTFIVVYMLLAVLLSVILSLFWLVVVVAAHLTFELVRQSHYFPGQSRKILSESIWEIKLDVAFILFSFVIAVYIDLILGIAGLGEASRMARAGRLGLRDGAEFGAFERGIRGVMLSADDIARTTSTALDRKGVKMTGRQEKVSSKAAHADRMEKLDDYVQQAVPTGEKSPAFVPTGKRWTRGDLGTVAFGGLCVVLLVLAPWLVGFSYEQLLDIIVKSLEPFPS